ncbi:hypothetical protein BSKO_10349 [Bryopsis sp. KO-2023]|nr:hypothetical protein BSKO_10349 [Bryopsis sp. KO-2023]
MAKVMDRVKTTLGLSQEEEQPKGFWESMDDATTLTRTQRLWGFGICAGVGAIFCLVGLGFALIPPYTRFAIMYTMGSICFIGSTFFLMGPWKQLKSMTKQYRIFATIAYVASLGLTLYAAFGLESGILIIIFFIIQLVALGWYILTYIPFGQRAIGSAFSSIFSS